KLFVCDANADRDKRRGAGIRRDGVRAGRCKRNSDRSSRSRRRKGRGVTDKAPAQDKPSQDTGYVLERLYFEKLAMQPAESAEAQPRAPDETISVGWDWGWASKNEFDVSLTVELPSSVNRR